MFSTLFHLGPLTLHAYGLCLAIGILVCYAVLSRRARTRGLAEETLGNLVVLLVVSGLVGARLFYVAEHWSSTYAADPLAAFRIWQGGLMFYGSLIVGSIALVAWCRLRHRGLLDTLDLFAVVMPLGQAFGRLGCFLNGCCYGRVSEAACAVSYPARSIPWTEQVYAGQLADTAARSLPVLPSQLFETAGCLAIFALLFWLDRRGDREGAHRIPGRLFALYLSLYAVLRFLVETTRADERLHPFGGPFTISQCISVGLLLLAAAIAQVSLRKSPSNP